MALKTYGKIHFDADKKQWVISEAQPHVCIKLKAIFTRIERARTVPFTFPDSPETGQDLHWFMERYPLAISPRDMERLSSLKNQRIEQINEFEAILLPDYKPTAKVLRSGYSARDYQLKGYEASRKVKRLLIGDDVGLGKTLIGILRAIDAEARPTIVVTQTNTYKPPQWKSEIEMFSDLKVHLVKGGKPYDLPAADVYIIKYTCLAGWTDLFRSGFFKFVVFDEAQELRRKESEKYKAAVVLSNSCEEGALGLSATPIYNFGDEIFNVCDVIKPGCLSHPEEFYREWCRGFSRQVGDPAALGTYLRENGIMLRRTRAEVGRELPITNTIVHYVDANERAVESEMDLATELALRVTNGTFVERGQAAREFDLKMRQITGIAKAHSVAAYVKILLENGEPVLLAGWHRAVYDIWKQEFQNYNPVFYTGTESPTERERAKNAFISGETDLMIISLRSAVGIDGLQARCKVVVIGEFDWSNEVHHQLIGRIRRDRKGGGEEQVTAIYLPADFGSDPVIINLLGIKASQSFGIMNPLQSTPERYTDESRIKVLAAHYLKKHHHQLTTKIDANANHF